MIAAIYARKSTEQHGVVDEQRSVTRQIEHARAYAQRKGWIVADEHVYVDDGISGAEFSNRPGFVRLMNALKGKRAPFQALMMSEVSRLGREQIETAYALKQLHTAGVRCFGYLEDRELLMESATDKSLLSAVNFGAELEREKARQRTYDAMQRKARAGHVTGGRVFGYSNLEIRGADDRRSHVERRIHEDEAPIVRRIFELCAAGDGLKGITKRLNAERAPSPRSQQGRPSAWAPSSVRQVLYRDCYRGLLVWNRTRKRDGWGRQHQHPRLATEWIRVPAEDLWIVSDALWNAAHGRLTERRENYRLAGFRAPDGRGVRQHYLLSGFARCGACGASIQTSSRRSGKRGDRLFRYCCSAHWSRGASVCANRAMSDMSVVNAAIREALAKEVLRPTVIERALDKAIVILFQMGKEKPVADRNRLSKRLRDVETTLANLTETAAKGGAVPAVLVALNKADEERRSLESELAALRRSAGSIPDPPPEKQTLRRTLRGYLDEWHEMLIGDVSQTRDLLRLVLDGERIVFTPAEENGSAIYRLQIPVRFDRLLVAVVPSLVRGTSPTGLATNVPPIGGPLPLAA
jgi:site-specific DNA recombinase